MTSSAFIRIFLFSIKQQYLLKERIEETIRTIFLNILADEIRDTEDEILKINLANLGVNIAFKYRLDPTEEKQHKTQVTTFFKKVLSTNKDAYFYRRYLDELITKVIDVLLGISDEDLASDYYHTKSIALVVLLRSIFLIINNYEELIPYEEYYNKVEKKETRAKKILRDAFIKHYDDCRSPKLKKLVKAS